MRANGDTIDTIAKELKVSTATASRLITGLALAKRLHVLGAKR